MPHSSGSDAPAVSVLLVAYNPGKFLAPAVESILAQTWSSFELVLIDNASTDGSVAGLAAAHVDPRVRIHRLPRNLGQSGGCRMGLPHCRGEFLAMTDADDLWLPRRLEEQLAYLRANPAIDLVTTLSDEVDVEARRLSPAFSLREENDIRAFAEFDMPVPLHTAMMRRAFAERVGFTTESSWACDYDFVVRALESGRIACLGAVHYLYRVHRVSVTSRGRNRQALAAGFVHFRAARRRRGEPVDETLAAAERRWLEQGPPLTKVHAICLRHALALRLPALAVFHARRARSPLRLASALLRAVAMEPSRAAFFCRLALWGPIRALGITAVCRPLVGSRRAVSSRVRALPADSPP